MKHILLIPAMLDAHFPLIKYAFCSKNYQPYILENEEGICDVGLKYVNNDMCYPAILIIGQMIAALQSGKYDISRTLLLMPSAGDACRGANYSAVLRRALKNAGFASVKVLSLNVRGLEKECAFKFDLTMVWKALLAMYYGDILMLLLNQTRPNEKIKGSSTIVWEKWIHILEYNFKRNRNLSLSDMFKNFDRIASDFSSIELIEERKKRVGIVGELYIKYCHIGNWDMIKYIEEKGFESHTNGLSWYAIYYIDTHLTEMKGIEGIGYRVIKRIFEHLQLNMIKTLEKYNFYTLPPFEQFKAEAKEYVSYDTKIGDGWLIGAEMASHILHDCPKVVAVQPFGCMPNHVCGRGTYPSIKRKLPQGQIVSVDVDSSGSKANVYNRVEMLLR